MRVLIVTNFYPPHEPGGQGYSCQQVVEGLAKCGHSVLVLTSRASRTAQTEIETFGSGTSQVKRSLLLEMDFDPFRHWLRFFLLRKRREAQTLQIARETTAQFNPDIIFIWGMWNLPRSLPALFESLHPDRIVYRFADYWPTLPTQHELYWNSPPQVWWGKLPKRVLRSLAGRKLAVESRPDLEFRRSICVSEAVRRHLTQSGVELADVRVIHTGLSPGRFRLHSATSPHDFQQRGGFKLLYAGRLVPEKGVDVAIRALGEMADFNGGEIELRVAGSGPRKYESELRRLAAKIGLKRRVFFLGRVQPEDMPVLMKNSHVLVMPSVWPEPFPRVVLEAMISGTVVIGSDAGGTQEAITDGKDGLIFRSGDAFDLARKLNQVVSNPTLRVKLAKNAKATMLERFTFESMLDQIEEYLICIHSQAQMRTNPECARST